MDVRCSVKELAKNLLAASEYTNNRNVQFAKGCVTCSFNLYFFLNILQEYPPTTEVMSQTLMAIFGALASDQRPRAERLILDLVATQVHGKDLTDLWDVTVRP